MNIFLLISTCVQRWKFWTKTLPKTGSWRKEFTKSGIFFKNLISLCSTSTSACLLIYFCTCLVDVTYFRLTNGKIFGSNLILLQLKNLSDKLGYKCFHGLDNQFPLEINLPTSILISLRLPGPPRCIETQQQKTPDTQGDPVNTSHVFYNSLLTFRKR